MHSEKLVTLKEQLTIIRNSMRYQRPVTPYSSPAAARITMKTPSQAQISPSTHPALTCSIRDRQWQTKKTWTIYWENSRNHRTVASRTYNSHPNCHTREGPPASVIWPSGPSNKTPASTSTVGRRGQWRCSWVTATRRQTRT